MTNQNTHKGHCFRLNLIRYLSNLKSSVPMQQFDIHIKSLWINFQQLVFSIQLLY